MRFNFISKPSPTESVVVNRLVTYPKMEMISLFDIERLSDKVLDSIVPFEGSLNEKRFQAALYFRERGKLECALDLDDGEISDLLHEEDKHTFARSASDILVIRERHRVKASVLYSLRIFVIYIVYARLNYDANVRIPFDRPYMLNVRNLNLKEVECLLDFTYSLRSKNTLLELLKCYVRILYDERVTYDQEMFIVNMLSVIEAYPSLRDYYIVIFARMMLKRDPVIYQTFVKITNFYKQKRHNPYVGSEFVYSNECLCDLLAFAPSIELWKDTTFRSRLYSEALAEMLRSLEGDSIMFKISKDEFNRSVLIMLELGICCDDVLDMTPDKYKAVVLSALFTNKARCSGRLGEFFERYITTLGLVRQPID